MGMTDSVTPTFEEVRDIIAEYTGIERTRIAADSDLLEDLGVAGDDGDELFAEFDEAFDVDWTGLCLGVHFGNEGLHLPLPWQLKNNCVMYETQPCKVSDVVRAVDTGRWPGTKVNLRPRAVRLVMYLLSTLQTAVFAGMLAAVAATALIYLIDRS